MKHQYRILSRPRGIKDPQPISPILKTLIMFHSNLPKLNSNLGTCIKTHCTPKQHSIDSTLKDTKSIAISTDPVFSLFK